MNKYLITAFLAITVGLQACKPGRDAADSQTSGNGQISEKEQVSFTYVFLNAAREKMLGNYDAAVTLFRESIRINPDESAPYYELAGLYYYMDMKDQAIQMAKKAVELDEKNTWYRNMYIAILNEQGDFSGAAKELEKLVKIEPGNPEHRLELAETLRKAGKYSDAIKVFESLEAEVGINEEISRQKQYIYLTLNQVDKAVAEAEKLIAAYPGEPRYLAMLADIYRSNEEPEKAFEVYQRLLKADPGNPFALLSLADHHRAQGDEETAFNYLSEAYKNPALDIDTKIKILLSFYVMSEQDAGVKEDAYKLINILKESHPREAKTWSVAGDFLVRDNRYSEAREMFRKAVALDPSRLPIWNQLLLLESDLGDFEAMLEESARAVELFPSNPSVYFFKGVALSRLNRPREALEPLQAAAALVVDDNLLAGQIHSAIGDAYHKLGEDELSDKAYDKSLTYDPDNVFVLNNYSYYLSLRGKELNKAAAMALKANKAQPGNASFQDTYGWILFRQGKYKEAEEWIRKAMESDGGQSPVILEHYGDVLFRLNRNDEAINNWQKALEMQPDNVSLREKIVNSKVVQPEP